MNWQPADYIEYLGEVSKWYRQAPVVKDYGWWVGKAEVMMDDIAVGHFDYVEDDIPAYIDGEQSDSFADFKMAARDALNERWMQYEAELASLSHTGTGSQNDVTELMLKRDTIAEALDIVRGLNHSD